MCPILNGYEVMTTSNLHLQKNKQREKDRVDRNIFEHEDLKPTLQ